MIRIFEFLAAYFRSGGGRVVERPAPACAREGLTPDIDGATDTLIVDCSVHGEIGRIDANRFALRDHEYDDAEALFAEHVAEVARAVPEVVPLDSLLEARRGRDELDAHYAEARAVVDAGRLDPPTTVLTIDPAPIAPAPPAELPDRS